MIVITQIMFWVLIAAAAAVGYIVRGLIAAAYHKRDAQRIEEAAAILSDVREYVVTSVRNGLASLPHRIVIRVSHWLGSYHDTQRK